MLTLKKRKFVFVWVLFALLVTYLLWPLKSSEFEIEDDTEAIEEKNNFLKTDHFKTDSIGPNIILITVDDLGMADVSLYGEGDVSTPNIDKLGEQGVVFENAYVTSPVCAPSRAAIITGRYQHRYGFEFTMQERYLKNRLEYLGFKYFINSDPWEPKWMNRIPDKNSIHNQGLPLSEITLAEVLKRRGYQTGIIGKWHLGWSEDRRPIAFGFDEQYGFFHSHSLYSPEGTKGIFDQKIEGDWTDPYIWSGQRNGPHAIYRNYQEIEEKEYLTDRITDESISFIENHKGESFFLWVSYNAPHTPLQAPEEYVNKYKHIKDTVKRVYRAMINKLDDEIGRFMNYLSENKLDKNTLIFFISDNGGAEYTLTTDNGKYEGGKNTEFEGGVKVPMIIRWIDNIPDGQRYDPMVSSLDIFRTSIAAADAEMLSGRELDGINLLPFLQDSIQNPPHQYLFWKRGISKVVRTNEWKLVMNDIAGENLLFNLAANRYENPDLSGDHKEIADSLSKAFDQWSETHMDPLWPSVIYYTCIKDGTKYYFDQ